MNIDQFAILANESVSGELSVSYAVTFKYSPEGKRIACILDLKYEKDAIAIMVLKQTSEFVVPESDWARYSTDNGFELPSELRLAIAAQTIGAARGVLFCKTEGTPFNNLILPFIDVSELMNR